ncbi:putative isochorismatase hydrolase [Diaporthe ampelina]|uniref:Putative isochorismatase hydrolase n=1 Tax=Diaporthe ampelina TaxID=1214573 RepID=A0A0G2I8U0_9PEZI|nr:putative isochorismatase hydrolase [Diaporthe ampelina]
MSLPLSVFSPPLTPDLAEEEELLAACTAVMEPSTDAPLKFGPPGDQWAYDRPSRTYDLTRGVCSPAPIKIHTSRGPPDTSVLVAPAAAVLVVVDMQNYFLHPSCRSHPAGLAAVGPLLRVIERCRSAGIQVAWLNWGLTDLDLAAMPAGVARGFARAVVDGDKGSAGLGVDLGGGKGRCLVAGEWNAEIYGPLGSAVDEVDDVRCAKNRMSGLWCEGQPLWRYLEKSGKKTLLFAGVNTDQCVLGTLTDAYNAGWDCVLVEDACATKTEGAAEVCLTNIAKNYGFVVDSTTFTASE